MPRRTSSICQRFFETGCFTGKAVVSVGEFDRVHQLDLSRQR